MNILWTLPDRGITEPKWDLLLKIHTYINLQLTILMRIQIRANHLTQMYSINLRNTDLKCVCVCVCEEIDGIEKTLWCTLLIHIPLVGISKWIWCLLIENSIRDGIESWITMDYLYTKINHPWGLASLKSHMNSREFMVLIF